MAIITLSSLPISGGIFDFSGNRENLAVAELERSKYLVVYRQVSPDRTLGQIIYVESTSNHTFGPVWVLNKIANVDAYSIAVLNSSKAILGSYRIQTSSKAYFQVLDIDNEDNIISGSAVGFNGASSAQTIIPNKISVYNSSIALFFFYQSTGRVSRINVAGSALSVSAPVARSLSYDDETNNYFPDRITGEDYVITCQGAYIYGHKLTIDNINNLALNIACSSVYIGYNNAFNTGTMRSFNAELFENNTILMTYANGSETNKYYVAEYNVGTEDFQIYDGLTSTATDTEGKIILKINDNNFSVISRNNMRSTTSATAFVGELNYKNYYYMYPGMLPSQVNEMNFHGSFRQNSVFVTANSSYLILNRNAFQISPNLSVYFFKTDTNYRILTCSNLNAHSNFIVSAATSGNSAIPVNLEYAGLGSVSQYAWYLNNMVTPISTDKSANVTLTSAGNYKFTLAVSGTYGNDIYAKNIYFNVVPSVVPIVSANVYNIILDQANPSPFPLSNLRSFFPKPDGTQFYIIEGSPTIASQNALRRSFLSVPWDINTVMSHDMSFSLSTVVSGACDVFFKDDGSRFYVLGSAQNRLYQYNLSTSWNISTASYSFINAFLGAQDTRARSIYFKSDGSKFYMLGKATKSIHQYSLPIPWNISSASYDGVSYNFSAEVSGTSYPIGLFFREDGKELIISCSPRKFLQYKLNTPWEVNSITYLENFSFNTDRIQNLGEPLKQYHLKTSNFLVTLDSSRRFVRYKTGRSFTRIKFPIRFRYMYISPDGTNLFTCFNNVITRFTLSVPYDVSTFSFHSSRTLTYTLVSFSFNNTGTILTGFEPGVSLRFRRYNLSVPWDITTASFFSSSPSCLSGSSQGIISNDGTRAFVIRPNGNGVDNYYLTAPWTFPPTWTPVYTFITTPYGENYNGLYLNEAGNVFIIGPGYYNVHTINRYISKFDLSSPNELSTIYYDKDLVVSTQMGTFGITNVGVASNYLGSKLYFYFEYSATEVHLYQIDLDTPWNISL